MATLHSIYDATLEYLRRVLVAFDMLCCVIFGGQSGDTISYTAAVAQLHGEKWGCVLCRILNLFQKNHCQDTIAANDKQRILWGEAIENGQQPL